MNLEEKQTLIEEIKKAFGDQVDLTKIVCKKTGFGSSGWYSFYYVLDTVLREDNYYPEFVVVDHRGDIDLMKITDVQVLADVNPVKSVLKFIQDKKNI